MHLEAGQVRPAVHWLQKAGHPPDLYEDAAASNADEGRFAVADGVSEAYASGRWARMVTQALVEADWPRGRAELTSWVKDLSARWEHDVRRADLPWYQEEKLRRGSSCTFLALRFEECPPGTGSRGSLAAPDGTASLPRAWTALAQGDTCLFQVRDGELIPPTPLPVDSPAGFTTGRPNCARPRPMIRSDSQDSTRCTGSAHQVTGSFSRPMPWRSIC